jgi:hypothetical protein
MTLALNQRKQKQKWYLQPNKGKAVEKSKEANTGTNKTKGTFRFTSKAKCKVVDLLI